MTLLQGLGPEDLPGFLVPSMTGWRRGVVSTTARLEAFA